MWTLQYGKPPGGIQMTFRTADTSQERHSLQNFADTALKAAARFSFLVAVRKHEPIRLHT